MRKARKESTHEIAMVRWVDAHSDGGDTWTYVEDLDPDPCIVVSVGIMLSTAVKPGHISLAHSIAHGAVDYVIHIPEKMVKEVTVLTTVDLDEL